MEVEYFKVSLTNIYALSIIYLEGERHKDFSSPTPCPDFHSKYMATIVYNICHKSF